MNGHFELNAAIGVEDVPEVRRLVERLHRQMVTDSDERSRIAVAAHELLENAVKFSTDGAAWMRIEIADGALSITTRNRARPADFAELSQLAHALETAGDPMLFYLGLMQKSPSSAGGLGLGRVAAEGEMQIALELEGDVVVVRARSHLGTRAEPIDAGSQRSKDQNLPAARVPPAGTRC